MSREFVLRFGGFLLEVEGRRLFVRGESVEIQDLPLTALIHLVQNADRLVRREELAESLWGAETFVDAESGLNTAMRKVRDALGDSVEEPEFIETVPGRGYRFIAAVRRERGTSSNAPELVEPRRGGSTVGLAASGLIAVLAVVGVLVFERSSGPTAGSGPSADVGVSLECADELTVRIAVTGFLADGDGEELGELVHVVREDVVGALWNVDRLRLAAKAIASTSSVSAADSDVVLTGRLREEGEQILLTVRLLEPARLEPIWARTFTAPRGNVYRLRSQVAETVASFLEQAVAAA